MAIVNVWDVILPSLWMLHWSIYGDNMSNSLRPLTVSNKTPQQGTYRRQSPHFIPLKRWEKACKASPRPGVYWAICGKLGPSAQQTCASIPSSPVSMPLMESPGTPLAMAAPKGRCPPEEKWYSPSHYCLFWGFPWQQTEVMCIQPLAAYSPPTSHL